MDTTKLKARLEDKAKGLEKPAEAAPVLEAAPAPVDSGYIALTTDTLPIIRENLKNQPLSLDLFDLVKSPSGGATVFSVPGLAGEEAEKELTGIILDYTTPRAYWDTPDPVEGTPPVCMSQDSIVSNDGRACAHCPYNDFGSKDGESNADSGEIVAEIADSGIKNGTYSFACTGVLESGTEISGGTVRVTAVSYTHLDVYKRQVLHPLPPHGEHQAMAGGEGT